MRLQSKLVGILAIAMVAMPMTACKVKQTQEGELPKVEGGQLPKYDVQPAEVKVDTTPVEVTVPTVDVSTEKKTVEVPHVDIKMPESSPTPTPHP